MLSKVLSIKPGVGQNRFLCAILEYVRTCFCVLSKGQSWSRSEQASVCYPRFYLLCLEYVRICFCELSKVVSVKPGGGQNRFCVLFKALLSLEEVRTSFYVLSKVLSVKPGVGQNTILCAEVLSVKHGVGQNTFLCAIQGLICQAWRRSEQVSVCYPRFYLLSQE